MLEFELVDEHSNTTSYVLEEGEYLLGKGDQCDVILADSHASRVHCKLHISQDQALLEDNSSTNGTWYKGERLDSELALKADDVVEFGTLKLVVKAVPNDEFAMFTGTNRRLESNVVQESEELIELKRRIHSMILEYLDLRKRNNLQEMSPEQLREEAQRATHDIIDERVSKVPDALTKEELERQVVAEAVGLGALEPLLDDDSVTEVMVNGADQIYVEKNGRLSLAESRFTGTQSLLAIIDRIVAPLGRRIDESSPMVDARLPDGSRVNAIIPPLALNGPTITIRKFAKKNLYVNDLLKFGTLSEDMARFIKSCVELKQNVVISGGTGSGKTTTLNILSNFIGEDDRIVTIEDAAELKLNQPHVVSLESRPANAEGKGKVSIRDLVINALRMRPDRIVVGECRGGEALDMLQAMNTGHDGSLTTGHANSPSDFLARLEVMVLMAGVDLPSRAIREQIASAVDILIQQSRLSDGSRKITHIMEVEAIEGDTIKLKPIFEYVRKGNGPDGKIMGEFVATGYVPAFYRQSIEQGIELDTSIFGDTGASAGIHELQDVWN
ncbi:MAG: Flp pilus assembly complex ATPase component TadA [Pseudomonadales bacterium]|nr:Flp pilus assembly complex ATPase component TadA [Pseudomonadales bacterium]